MGCLHVQSVHIPEQVLCFTYTSGLPHAGLWGLYVPSLPEFSQSLNLLIHKVGSGPSLFATLSKFIPNRWEPSLVTLKCYPENEALGPPRLRDVRTRKQWVKSFKDFVCIVGKSLTAAHQTKKVREEFYPLKAGGFSLFLQPSGNLYYGYMPWNFGPILSSSQVLRWTTQANQGASSFKRKREFTQIIVFSLWDLIYL